jgi:transcription initiation factor TFIID TATA-box-binding protein
MALVINQTLTADLRCFLDLRHVANNCTNIVYSEGYFNRCVKKDKRSTLLIYSSGKVVCLGSKSFEEGRLSIRRFARRLQRIGYRVILRNIETANIVAKNKLTNSIDLYDLQDLKGCIYVKEIFPNLRYTSVNNPKHKVILSWNGNYILTGVKSAEELVELEKEFIEKVKNAID